MRSIIICIIDCIMSMRFSIICWRAAVLAGAFPGAMPPIIDMPSCMSFMCSAIMASRSAGVFAPAICSCIDCMAYMCLAIMAMSGMPAGLPVAGAGIAAEAAPAG